MTALEAAARDKSACSSGLSSVLKLGLSHDASRLKKNAPATPVFPTTNAGSGGRLMPTDSVVSLDNTYLPSKFGPPILSHFPTVGFTILTVLRVSDF